MSARNIPDVKTTQINTINTYDVMKYNTVIATKAAVEQQSRRCTHNGKHSVL